MTPLELTNLLISRLNLSKEDELTFLNPAYMLADVFLFEDMKRACERIYAGVVAGEEIGIYADYDCDGIPGAVVLVDFFRMLGYIEHVHVYIPDRHDEGYGVSKVGLDTLKAKGVSLIITVDMGITAIKEVEYAQEMGIEVIVTDHHAGIAPEKGGHPKAFAIIHPEKSSYQNQFPCGAAVAFYLVVGFLELYRKEFGVIEGAEKWLLDMVGFATLSDMVPLVGENRMLVKYGMMVLQKARRVGLRTLLVENGVSLQNLTETDLTFTLAPRLNAASRMASPALAFEILSTDSAARALDLAKELQKINDERKKLVAKITKEAHSRLDKRELSEIVVVGDLSWRPAVLGLVANKLQEAYGKSFFVWGEAGDGIIKGSCRMLDEHHAAYLFQALPEGALLHGGGHQAAGGFAVAKDRIHFFEEELNKAIAVVGHVATEKAGYDPIELPVGSAGVRHLQAVRAFAPFGVGNQEPVFVFKNVDIVSTKMFGKNKEHIECTIKDTTGSAIAFTFFADEILKTRLIAGAQVSLTGTLEAGWKGGVRLHIKEIIK